MLTADAKTLATDWLDPSLNCGNDSDAYKEVCGDALERHRLVADRDRKVAAVLTGSVASHSEAGAMLTALRVYLLDHVPEDALAWCALDTLNEYLRGG